MAIRKGLYGTPGILALPSILSLQFFSRGLFSMKCNGYSLALVVFGTGMECGAAQLHRSKLLFFKRSIGVRTPRCGVSKFHISLVGNGYLTVRT
jgi:hypothetical protein